jgi:hypothetical protein
MEAVYSSETLVLTYQTCHIPSSESLVPTYQTTRCHNLVDQNQMYHEDEGSMFVWIVGIHRPDYYATPSHTARLRQSLFFWSHIWNNKTIFERLSWPWDAHGSDEGKVSGSVGTPVFLFSKIYLLFRCPGSCCLSVFVSWSLFVLLF